MPALHVNKLLWHNSENAWLYAGTDMGIFATENNGQNWNVSPNIAGISDGPVFTEITNLEWGSPGAATGFSELYVTTYGRGMEDKWSCKRWGCLQRRKPFWCINDRLNDPFDNIEDAESVKAHGQTWHFDAPISPLFKTEYPVPSGGVLLDKRIGVIKKFPGKAGGVVIGN